MTRPITVDTLDNQFIIKIDKDQIDKERLLQLVNSLRIEAMAERVNLGEDIEKLGKEIKSSWWEANRDRFIPLKKGE